MKRTILILMLVFASTNFVCNSQQEKKAAQFADTYAHSLSAVHASIDTAHANGKISETDYQAILRDLLTANQGGLDLNVTIRGIANGTNNKSQLNPIVQGIELALIDGTAHIKDPNTAAEVQAAVSAINLVLTSIEQIYGGQ